MTVPSLIIRCISGVLFCFALFFAVMHGVLMVLATVSGDSFDYFLRLGVSRMRGEKRSPSLLCLFTET